MTSYSYHRSLRIDILFLWILSRSRSTDGLMSLVNHLKRDPTIMRKPFMEFFRRLSGAERQPVNWQKFSNIFFRLLKRKKTDKNLKLEFSKLGARTKMQYLELAWKILLFLPNVLIYKRNYKLASRPCIPLAGLSIRCCLIGWSTFEHMYTYICTYIMNRGETW
jgi:hypothetical protein